MVWVLPAHSMEKEASRVSVAGVAVNLTVLSPAAPAMALEEIQSGRSLTVQSPIAVTVTSTAPPPAGNARYDEETLTSSR